MAITINTSQFSDNFSLFCLEFQSNLLIHTHKLILSILQGQKYLCFPGGKSNVFSKMQSC